MNKNIKVIFGIILLIIAIFLIIKGVHKKHLVSDNQPLKVGALLILSGEFSPYGERSRYAIEIAADEYNQNPKHIRKVEVVYEDTKADVKTAIAAYQKLVSVDHVDAIVGPLLQTEMSVLEPLIKQDNIPVFGISLASPESRGNSNPLGLWPDPTLEAQQMAQYVYDQGVRSVAVVGTKDSWEEEVNTAFADKFQTLGGTITAKNLSLTSDNDLRVDVTKVIATKPEAVFLGTYYKFYQYLKNFKQLGYQGKLYSIEIDTTLAEQTKDVSNGLQFISPSYYASDFATTFKEKAGYEPSIPAGQAHDAIALYLSLYKPGDTKEDILKKMSEVTEFEGASGRITFPNHKAMFPFLIFELQNGTIKAI